MCVGFRQTIAATAVSFYMYEISDLWTQPVLDLLICILLWHFVKLLSHVASDDLWPYLCTIQLLAFFIHLDMLLLIICSVWISIRISIFLISVALLVLN